MTRPAEYWKKRAEANMDRVQEGAEQHLARLGRAYRQAAQELTDEVKRILGTYAKRFDLTPEEAAAALQEPFDEESRAYGYRVSRAEALKAAIQERMNRLGVQVERETAAQREWTASKSYQSARKMVQDMTGGLVNHATPDLRGMLQAMDTVWAGGNYSARIWKNTERLAETLSSEIEAAFLSGKSVRRMADTIMERFGVGYRAAECLVRTETSYVQNRTAARSYEDAGCTEYEVLTAQDRRTCQYCAKQNGKRYLLATMQAGENAPPFHPNCRCTVLPVVEEKGQAGLQFGQKDAMIQTRGNSSMSISSPIEARHTGKGNPSGIAIIGKELNNRQKIILDRLPEFSSRTVVGKKQVNMRDLAALTAYTGDEYAMFTKGGQRLLIRGDSYHVAIYENEARNLAEEGYKWSGHTHPGMTEIAAMPSDGDYTILRSFGQKKSVIMNSKGQYTTFGEEE
mgnify:CR=1 FL=1